MSEARNRESATSVDPRANIAIDDDRSKFEVSGKDPNYHYVGFQMKDNDGNDHEDMRTARFYGYEPATGDEQWVFGKKAGKGKPKILDGNRILMKCPRDIAMKRRQLRANKFEGQKKPIPSAKEFVEQTARSINAAAQDGKGPLNIVQPVTD